jgi:hypothetical protein
VIRVSHIIIDDVCSDFDVYTFDMVSILFTIDTFYIIISARDRIVFVYSCQTNDVVIFFLSQM